MDPPPPEGTIVKSETKTVKTEDDGSVVTTTKTVYVTTVPIDDNSETAANTLQRLCSGESEDIKDIDFLKPTAVRRSFIDREAYLRLHHINGNRKSIDSLKVKYEQASNADKITDSADTPSQAEKTVEHVDDLQAKLKLSDATIESLKSKYSPSSFGYPKSEEATSPLKRTPPATPKRSVSLKSPQKPEVPAKPESLQKNFRHSYIPFSSQPRPVVAKRSSLIVARAPRIPDKPTDIYENLPFESRVQSPPVPRLRNSTIEKLAVDEEDEEEERIIIRRAPSEDCMLKIQADLEDFTMDGKQKPKDKKRTSSFRNILTGGLFKKDGKKKSDKNPDKVKTKKTENGIVADNAQNEHRNSQNEHTLLQRQNSSGRGDNVQYNRHPMQRQNSIGRGDHYEQTNRNIQRQNSIGRGDNYDHVNRPVQSQIQRQNSIGKADMERRYAEMYINEFNKKKAMFGTEGQRHIQDDGRKGVDMESSSSSNTLESEGRGTYQNALLAQAEMMYLRKLELETMGESPTPNTDTPPRLKETQMITSKASIPINSRRALPNPYQQRDDTTDANLNIAEKVEYVKSPNYDFDPYGTKQSNGRGSCSPNVTKSSNSSNVTPSSPTISARSSPRSPTLEGSKLRLPTNREKVNLQPRLKSPIPQPKISTDKIIATELLKKSDKKLDKQAPTHQKLEIEIDYPDSYQQTNHAPSSQMSPPLEGSRYHQPPREFATMPSSQKSQASPVEGGRYHQPQREVASLPISQKSQASPIEGGRYHQPQREVASPPTSQKSQASPIEAGRYHQPQREVASPPTSQKSQASPIEAGRYQQQREMVKSPSLVGLEAKQVTTDATVHKESSPIERNSEMYGSLPVRGRPLPQDIRQRSVTPVRRIPSNASLQYSPSKQEMRQSVEMYCWKEIQKLKEKQDQELNYQLQYTPYGYVEDPIIQRRSRSTEPTQHRGRRSTSLPREVRPSQADRSNRYNHPLAIPENRPVYYGENDIYGQRNPNFVRSSPQRRTVSTISRGYEGYYANTGEVPYRPIFNRGSLNPQSQLDPQYQSQKKNVSFNGNAQPVAQWPTRNGYVASPPQRRLEKNMSVESDDVFLPNVPPNRANDARMRQMNEQMQRQIMKDPIYGSRAEVDGRMRMEEPPYGTRRQIEESYIIRRQIIEDPYGNRQVYQQTLNDSNPSLRSQEILNEPIYAVKENKHNSHEVSRQKQENLQNIYGSKHDPELYKVQPMNSMYASKISVQESPYGTREPIYGTRPPNGQHESPYGYRTGPPTLPPALSPNDIYGQNPKQITVSNKVCDMYGRIHDNGQKVPVSPPYGPVQQSGVIYGQLQGNGVTGRPPLHHSYNQLPNSFVRGSRLTSSANDMYRRPPHDPRYHHPPGFNPNAPLPPTPAESKTHVLMRRRGHPTISDTESETSEVRTIMNRNYIEEEWNSDGKSGRGVPGNESGSGRGENEIEVRSRSRNPRRDDPRRHTLGGDQQYSGMAGQGGPLSRTMDLEGQPRGYPPPTNSMLFDDDPGIMSEVETSSTGFRRGGKQRSSLPVVRTPSKTLERPLGLVFLQYRNETKRALLPNEITSIDTVKALFVRSFPKQLTMEYLDSPQVKIYIHDSSKDMFYELEDLRSHLREIRDRSVLRLFESADVSGGLPMAGIGIAGGVGHFEDPSYFSEPEFDSEYQHQHIHKSKGSTGKSAAPYYMGSTASLPRSGLLRAYSPAVTAIPPERIKPLPTDGYMSSPERGSRYEDPYYSQYSTRSGSITPVIDEEVSDTELLDESYALYGVKLPTSGPRATPRAGFAPPAGVPYDVTRIRVEHMERQLANLTGLVQKALTQTPPNLQVPSGRDGYRADETFQRTDSKTPKLGKAGCHKSVSFEKSVSFSDEPPDMNSPKQHSPQHTADTKPPKPAIKSSTLPRTSSQERDRLKPAPPPKPASLSPGQYDGRHIYRDLQLTPEMYNQLRGLQKKAKDLRTEVRNLRRMSQAQAHSVRETIRDTFIKIRAMLLAGGEQVWQAGMDQERLRLCREEDLYKQEMLRLEKDLTELESTVEELRGNVINRKTRVNMSDVENMALILSKSSKTVADLKLRFPNLQDSMKVFLTTEMEKVVREETFLKEEPERLESALRRCKKLTGTLVTLKRLASVQEQRLPCSTGAADGRLSPTITETPPVTPTSAQHSKPTPSPRMGQVVIGGDSANSSDSSQRPENALDALLDELQTFSKPHPSTVNTQMPQAPFTESEPPSLPAKGIAPSHSSHFNHPPTMSEIGRKGSMDSATILQTQNLTVSTATGSLRRLHSYPSGSDTDNSPPIQPIQRDKPTSGKPPLPERNTELLQHISGKRIPPPPPPRTSSKSPLASPTSPSLPPRSPATGLQHIQNVQNMVENKPQSQFEQATQNLGLGTLRRNANRSSIKDRAQTLPRNIGSNLQVHSESENTISASNSSSCESVNSQDGTKKRKEELEQRHQELLKKQKALQEQYARLQQLQRGNNTLAVIPPAPDQLLKKTGSESNLMQKMGLQMSAPQMTGSLTNLPNTTTSACKTVSTETVSNSSNPTSTGDDSTASSTTSSATTTTSKVYETDIL